MTKKVVLIGSLDTKGAEFRYVKEVVESLGVHQGWLPKIPQAGPSLPATG